MPKRSRTTRAAPTAADAGVRPADAQTGGAQAATGVESAAGSTSDGSAVTFGGVAIPPIEPGSVAVHEGLALIEVADPADLAALVADPRLAALVLARIGERAAVALPQAAVRLLLALAKAGHTPTVEGEP